MLSIRAVKDRDRERAIEVAWLDAYLQRLPKLPRPPSLDMSMNLKPAQIHTLEDDPEMAAEFDKLVAEGRRVEGEDARTAS